MAIASVRAWAKLTRARECPPTIVLSSTVSVGKIARFWNVRATPRRITPCVGSASRSCPSKLIRPAAGRTIRVQQLNSVVLPAPFGALALSLR